MYHIDLEEIDSTALLEQLRVVSKLRFITPYKKRGSLVTISKKDWFQIDSQLKLLYKLRLLQK